ncbi:MAG TPA: hypothetical protein VL282_00130, partial [Tepidisphaeraceae bacterium]|nr:hypothetical protein [Tepidisphaeraceae bacterium]
MSQLSYMTPGVVGFKDRRTRLLVTGILIMLGGIICLLMAGMIPIALYLPRPPGAPTPRSADLAPGVVLYIVLAIVAFSLAIGAIRLRRWVRPVILCISVIWLLIGIGGLVVFAVTVPQMVAMMQAQFKTAGGPPMPTALIVGIAVGTGLFSLLFYIGLPLLLFLLFRGRDVQATLDFFDPHPRWTDGVPLIILGLSMVSLLGAIGSMFGLPTGLFLFFGIPLMGWPGRIALIVVAVLSLIVSRLIYRRKIA